MNNIRQGRDEVEIGPSTLEERKRVLEVIPRICEGQNRSVCVKISARVAPTQVKMWAAATKITPRSDEADGIFSGRMDLPVHCD